MKTMLIAVLFVPVIAAAQAAVAPPERSVDTYNQGDAGKIRTGHDKERVRLQRDIADFKREILTAWTAADADARTRIDSLSRRVDDLEERIEQLDSTPERGRREAFRKIRMEFKQLRSELKDAAKPSEGQTTPEQMTP